MGLGNWFLKNAPGSPGSTAKHIINLYHQLTGTGDSVPEAAWIAIYFGRHQASLKMGNNTAQFGYFGADALYSYSKGDWAILIFIVLYIETQQFRDGIAMGKSGFDSTLDVIKEVVQKKAPQLITLDSDTYRTKVLKFITDIYIYETSKGY